MGQGGAGNTDNNEAFAKGIVNLARDNKDLKQITEELLLKNTDLQRVNSQNQSPEDKPLTDERAIELLSQDPELLETTKKYFKDHPEELKKLIEEFGKDPITMQKADSFGKILAVGIGGAILGGIVVAAFGGLLGAGLAAAAPFIGLGILALVAIAAIGFALFSLFKNKEKIGEKAKDIGKEVTHLLKNLIDKLPLRSSNAVNYLAPFYAEQIEENSKRINAGNPLPDDAAFVEQYLLNKDGFKALEEQIKKSDGQKITLKDKDNKEVELTLKDLERLKEKGNSTFKDDEKGFKEELDKFKLIISETNKDIRKQVETKQDEIHKYSGKPAPSSALYPGSVANNELLTQVKEGEQRKGVKDLLEKVAELRDTGKNEGFREDFHKVLKAAPYEIDGSALEKKGGLTDTESKDLADELKKLTPDKIKDLSDKVDDLKKDQSKGPRAQKDQVQTPEQYKPIVEPGMNL